MDKKMYNGSVNGGKGGKIEMTATVAKNKFMAPVDKKELMAEGKRPEILNVLGKLMKGEFRIHLKGDGYYPKSGEQALVYFYDDEDDADGISKDIWEVMTWYNAGDVVDVGMKRATFLVDLFAGKKYEQKIEKSGWYWSYEKEDGTEEMCWIKHSNWDAWVELPKIDNMIKSFK